MYMSSNNSFLQCLQRQRNAINFEIWQQSQKHQEQSQVKYRTKRQRTSNLFKSSRYQNLTHNRFSLVDPSKTQTDDS